MIGRKIGTMPNFGLANLIKSNMVIRYLEWPEPMMELLESSQSLAQNI